VLLILIDDAEDATIPLVKPVMVPVDIEINILVVHKDTLLPTPPKTKLVKTALPPLTVKAFKRSNS